jgi:dihydroorotate dehydrogenase (fumarate)
MDLSTRYLGFTLPHPLILGASPLVDDLDAVRRAEDAGAAAIVMRSLFEEQITLEHHAERDLGSHEDSFAEALYFRPHRRDFSLGPDEYLEQVRRLKDAVKIPVIASLNGVTNQGWLEYTRLIDQAGADALELNVYRVATSPDETSDTLERRTLDMLKSVKSRTSIPVAVKLSPFYTALPNFAGRLADAGANGLVLFNRFYQPDIDAEDLAVDHHLELSSSSELLLRLRWLAILSAQLDVTFAASGGVHSPLDAVKAVMAGADGVQLVSEILKYGPLRFRELHQHMGEWLESHEYHSLAQMKDSMNLSRCPDPAVYERANYMRVLNSYRPQGKQESRDADRRVGP